MDYTIRVEGISPLIVHNGAAGLDKKSPTKVEITEITRMRGSNKVETSTTNDSSSSNAKTRFTSTRQERLRSRRQDSDPASKAPLES